MYRSLFGSVGEPAGVGVGWVEGDGDAGSFEDGVGV
jgi:hypothetical protein